MGVVSSRELCVCALVQNSISVTLRNFGQDCLDILRFTTPHDSSLPGRRACHMGVVSSRELCVCAQVLFLLLFVTLDRIVWTLLDSLHLMTVVCPVDGRGFVT